MHAEDADVLTLPVQADLGQRDTHTQTHTLSQDYRGTIMPHFAEMFSSDRKCFLLISVVKIEINVWNALVCVSVSWGDAGGEPGATTAS